MNKDEILAKSRAEYKIRDIYEQEIAKQANHIAVTVLLVLATLFFLVQILAGKGMNYGIYAIVLSGNMTVSWVRYAKLKEKNEFPRAVLYTLIVLALSGCHIYHLIASSKLC